MVHDSRLVKLSKTENERIINYFHKILSLKTLMNYFQLWLDTGPWKYNQGISSTFFLYIYFSVSLWSFVSYSSTAKSGDHMMRES